MLFSSITFLCLFLPLTVGIYYILPQKLRNAFLLLASIVFYAWGEPRYLLIMLATILTNYAGTLLLSHFEKYKKYFLTGTVLVDLGFLCYFKYVDFLIESFNAIFKTHADILQIALPLGISFYTFQAISYTVDVYRGDIKPQKSLYKLALYITLFPQLIAGPIVKYHNIADQIENRKETTAHFYFGLRRFIIGLSRKILIANTLGVVVDKVIELPVEEITTWEAWLAAICYAFQIYNDFGGYADMAIGICAMFGFTIKENFNFPFLSKSYTEFWHRWHISLGTWVKEYIYIPLGGNRCSPVRHYFNLFLAFFIIGVWHGADANMVMLGVVNGVLILFEKITGLYKEVSKWWAKILKHIYMFPLLVVPYQFLRSPDFSYTISFLKKLTGMEESTTAIRSFSYYIGNIEILVFVIAFLGSISVFRNFLSVSEKHFIINICVDVLLFAFLFLSISFIAASTYNPFIYFRF